MPDHSAKTEAPKEKPKEVIWLGHWARRDRPIVIDQKTGKSRELTDEEAMRAIDPSKHHRAVVDDRRPLTPEGIGQGTLEIAAPFLPFVLLAIVVWALVRTNRFAKQAFQVGLWLFGIVLAAGIIKVAVALLALGRAM